MEFKNSHVYTALNADYLRPGDKVIVADSLAKLRNRVMGNIGIDELSDILPDNELCRFIVKIGSCRCRYALAFLIEREKNCLNCNKKCYTDRSLVDKTMGCINWEPEIEKHESAKYRPFKDIDELIKVWGEIEKKVWGYNWFDNKQPMPLIWVRDKHREHDECFIVRYDRADNNIHIAGFGEFSLDSLFECFEFLDGTPCGVEV